MTIKMLILDVDGTLTDGRIYIGSQGEIMKAFNVKDGLGIVKLQTHGIIPVIITGRQSDILTYRAKELNIVEVFQGVNNKIEKLKEVLNKYDVKLKEVAYIGDDENDLECMKMCAIKGCPADAVDIVIKISDYVCKRNGGEGAVREFIDYLLKLNK